MSHQERKRKEHLRRQRAVEQAIASRERPLVEARDALAQEIVALRERNAELEAEAAAGRQALAEVDRRVAEAVGAVKAKADEIIDQTRSGMLSDLEALRGETSSAWAVAEAEKRDLQAAVESRTRKVSRLRENLRTLGQAYGRLKKAGGEVQVQLDAALPELERLRHEDRDAAKLRRRLHAATQENGVLNGKWQQLKQVVIAMIRENGRSFVPARFDRGYYASLMAEVYAEVDKQQREETTKAEGA